MLSASKVIAPLVRLRVTARTPLPNAWPYTVLAKNASFIPSLSPLAPGTVDQVRLIKFVYCFHAFRASAAEASKELKPSWRKPELAGPRPRRTGTFEPSGQEWLSNA